MNLLFSVIALALDTLRANKLRSFLTLLGVIIGTGAIIGVGSILAGLDNSVAGLIRSLGTNSILVFKFRLGPAFGGRTPEELLRKPLTYEDALAIAERCPSVAHVSPYLLQINLRGVNLDHARYQSNDAYQIQLGATDEYYTTSGQGDIKTGRFFSDAENQHRIAVAVIGEDVYGSLFGTQIAEGKKIQVDGREVEVVGVLQRPATSLPGQTDNRVLLPYFTMRKMFPQTQENLFFVQPREGRMAAAIDELTAVLRQRRHVPLSAPDNFAISTAAQMIDQFRQLTFVTGLVMVVLSSMGLLVGGIGVMNIMLVSVTERTREIGVRKAIGARRRDIVRQFLTEAVVLTSVGGLLGMTLGWMVSLASRFAFPNLPTLVPLWAVLLGSGVSIGLGLFFGIWPASKAARLDPVDALRYE
ncbi:MAG: ABC transporter permease [Acidobacteriota bacterium]|nr:ABC transporter permease [Acidobacteriota bacterium]